jgi:hypothetical protein
MEDVAMVGSQVRVKGSAQKVKDTRSGTGIRGQLKRSEAESELLCWGCKRWDGVHDVLMVDMFDH